MKRIAYIFLLILMVSCGSKNPVPREKMEQIIWDLALGNEYLNKYVVNSHPDINRGAAYNTMLEKILKKNNVSLKDFNKSIDEYLVKEPKAFERILDSVATNQLAILDKYRKEKSYYDSLQLIKDSALAKKDSLKNKNILKDSLSNAKLKSNKDSVAAKDSLSTNKNKPKATKKKKNKSKKKKAKLKAV